MSRLTFFRDRGSVLQNGTCRLGFRFPDLQFDAAKNMGMPRGDAQHVFILNETFYIRRLQAAAGQQKFHFAVKSGYGNEFFFEHAYTA